ncbi:MAG: ankyrin repeat domain-containing protein [Candidatus Babeliales bacterium]|jgi:hypothetical protein
MQKKLYLFLAMLTMQFPIEAAVRKAEFPPLTQKFLDVLIPFLNEKSQSPFEASNQGNNIRVMNAEGSRFFKIGEELPYAARIGFKDGIKTLLDAGVDINTTDSEGRTALMTIMIPYDKEGLTECVRMLLNAGANVNASDVGGDTTLHFAVGMSVRKKYINEITKCVRMLLDAGANIRAADRRGNTALHVLATKGDADHENKWRAKIAKMLMEAIPTEERRAFIMARNGNGETALNIARHTNEYMTHEIIRMMDAAITKDDDCPVCTRKNGESECRTEGGSEVGSEGESGKMSVESSESGDEEAARLTHTPCGHVICDVCLAKIRSSANPTCPICRRPLD